MFNVEFPGPIMVFDLKRLGEACGEIYSLGYYPMSIIYDRTNPVFKEAVFHHPKENIECIIIPIRYLTEFLA